MKLKSICLLTIFAPLLAGCDKGPSKAEIKELCKNVGDKAVALANDGTKDYKSLEWIEKGARAECELKYLSDR